MSLLSRPNVLGSKPHTSSWVWSVAILKVKPTRHVLVQIHFKLKLYHISANDQHLFPHILGADDMLQKWFHFRTLIGCPGMQCISQTMWSPTLTTEIGFLNNLYNCYVVLWNGNSSINVENSWGLHPTSGLLTMIERLKKHPRVEVCCKCILRGCVVVLGQGWVCMHVFTEKVCTSKQYIYIYINILNE